MSEKVNYNPDILSCLANLSSDEVFTPPEIANAMLDMLPKELFCSPDTKFLDPGCKSGVFLREIAKRLNKGLEDRFSNLEERMEHIMKRQLFGIAITQITGLLSRRSVYCSKDASSRFSIAKFFGNPDGNIRYKRVEHKWNGIGCIDDQKCTFCGASRKGFDRGSEYETHAYEFIHMDGKTLKELKDMKFDVIIGNPPYQLADGGAQASAIPIYNKFIEQAIKLNPRYLSMIIPARWYTGGRGLDSFRQMFLSCRRIRVLHDFPDASDCFNGVEIKGGVCYFLWNREEEGDCKIISHSGNSVSQAVIRPLKEEGCDSFIRNDELVSIFHKVKFYDSFRMLVSPMKPFGLRGDLFSNTKKYNLPSVSENPIAGGIVIHGLDDKHRRVKRYVPSDFPLPNITYLNGYKLFVARNQGSGILGEAFSEPIFAGPNECCTETFIVFGCFDTEEEMKNCYTYIRTKFFRAVVGIKKNDQGAGRNVYQFVPLQDFSSNSDISWSLPVAEIDNALYQKYGLTDEEIAFIESMIKPMDIGGVDA